MKVSNFFEDIPISQSKEWIQILAESTSVRIEKITSFGQISEPNFWYDQEENEWVCVLQGSARLRFQNGSEIILNTGDHVLIPSHEKHRVEYTSTDPACLWLAVFFK